MQVRRPSRSVDWRRRLPAASLLSRRQARHATASYVQGRGNDHCHYRSECQTQQTDAPKAAAPRAALLHRCSGRLGRRPDRLGCVKRGLYRAGEAILDIVARRQPWTRVPSNALKDSERRSSGSLPKVPNSCGSASNPSWAARDVTPELASRVAFYSRLALLLRRKPNRQRAL